MTTLQSWTREDPAAPLRRYVGWRSLAILFALGVACSSGGGGEVATSADAQRGDAAVDLLQLDPDLAADAVEDIGADLLSGDVLVIRDVVVVDVDGRRVDRTVLLSDGRVVVERPSSEVAWPEGSTEIDGRGLFLVPGLVDPHVHLNLSGATIWLGDALESNLRAALYHGVLAVGDVGGPTVLFELRDAIESGRVLGPRVRATGPFLTAVGSHPCEVVPDPAACRFVDAASAEAAARALAEAGADALKVAVADASFTPWPTTRLDLDALRAVAAVGLPVIAHVDSSADTVDAVAAGVDILGHPVFDGPMTDAARSAATSARATHTTLQAFGGVLDLVEGALDLDDDALIAAPGVRDNWAYVKEHPEVLLSGYVDQSRGWLEAAESNLVSLRDAGATLIPGSDAGYLFVPFGLGLHRELRALQALGWTPRELLSAATVEARELLGLEGGTVAPGQPADLLLLSADPSLDVAAWQAIAQVIRGGRVLGRESLREVDLMPGPASSGELCLEAADCPASDRCDPVDHRCRPACGPAYDPLVDCGLEGWCIAALDRDALSAGVCHPEPGCDLLSQDCGPEGYAMACLPLDVDSNGCRVSGPVADGGLCDPLVPARACAIGSVCWLGDGRCHSLCDPASDAPACAEALSCESVIAGAGTSWFAICR